jgi:hypothetical protein
MTRILPLGFPLGTQGRILTVLPLWRGKFGVFAARRQRASLKRPTIFGQRQCGRPDGASFKFQNANDFEEFPAQSGCSGDLGSSQRRISVYEQEPSCFSNATCDTKTARSIATGASSKAGDAKVDGSCNGRCIIWERSTTVSANAYQFSIGSSIAQKAGL